MKRILCLLLLCSFVGFGQDFQNLTLLDNWTNDALITSSTQVRYNDCFGFVHKGNEYAILGSTEGTHFFEITSENKLIEKDFVEGAFSSAQVVHRDFKTFDKYVYAVCDEGNSSLQIIDYSYLPDSVHVVNEIKDEIGRAHNLFVDAENELLYAFSVTPTLNGQLQTPFAMRVFSLQDPQSPQLLYSGPNDIAEVHDGFVLNNNAILNCGQDGLRRYDFSNPTAPVFVQNVQFYQDQGYNHQGWVNPAGDTYIFTDETNGKKLKKCSFSSSGDIQIDAYFGIGISEGSVAHNVMMDDQFAYVSYYNYGLRIFDYTKTPVEQVAYYDTYPDEKDYKLNGAWGVYSLFPSKRILASDRTYGLFLFDFDRSIFKNRTSESFQVYPNPVLKNERLTFFLNSSFKGSLSYAVFDNLGKKVLNGESINYNYLSIPFSVTAGTYTLKISYSKNQEEVEEFIPVVVY